MQYKSSQCWSAAIVVVLAMLLTGDAAFAQTTAFTYQGKLTDGGNPANGNYDLQFALFDSLSAGTQVGSTIVRSGIAVSGGIFTVSLDFGAAAFPGASRWLEISTRLSGAPAFTTLSPRQAITATPYAVRSLNASTADTVVVSGVPSGSANYIQNTSTLQSGSNFNISGNGTVAGTISGSVVNATTQYNLNGNRVLSNPANNVFVGKGAGTANTTGDYNIFVGNNAGASNTSAFENCFFGDSAGRNTTGSFNSFFGDDAGIGNTTGSSNSFFGDEAGSGNTTGSGNSFFGETAGFDNGTGANNAFFGRQAGSTISSGSLNTAIGYRAVFGFSGLNNATAIGALSRVDQSNSLVLGSVAGENNATVTTRVGIGTTAPLTLFHVHNSGSVTPMLLSTGSGSEGPASFRLQADSGLGGQGRSFVIYEDSAAAYRLVINGSGNVGIGITAPQRLLHVNGRARVGSIPPEASAASVCFNFAGDLLQCGASSLRLKTNIKPFFNGLDIIRRLHPISFDWKEDGRPDIGLGAEDVAKVSPSLTFNNDKGEVAGVKYEKLNLLLINAVKEQQQQIELQQKQINALRSLNQNLSARLRTLEQRDQSRRHARRPRS